MSQVNRPKLSLLAQFDDLNRLSVQLAMGTEDEFLKLVKTLDVSRESWNIATKALKEKEVELLKVKKENGTLETKLKHAKSLVVTEMQKRLKIENEKKSLERQISLIKEVLLSDQNALNDHTKEKLAFLNSGFSTRDIQNTSPRILCTIEESFGSILSTSDVSFDKTDDDLDSESKTRRSKSKRRSSRSQNTSKKTKFDDNSTEDDNLDSTSLESKSSETKSNEVTIPKQIWTNPSSVNTRQKQCFSEPVPNCNVVSPPRQICKSEDDPFDDGIPLNVNRVRGTFTRTLSENSPLRRYSSSGKLGRTHVFCTKTVIRPEKCYHCGERMRFSKQALKCQDCRITCHPECKNKVPSLCYPSSHTPTGKGPMGTIADYAPPSSPMIPAILIHCINEIESRGLTELGLYRISGSEREVKDLKEKFLKGKAVPCLNKIDIHAICGTVKDFLRSLREPLIARNLWKDFVTAVEILDPEQAIKTVCEAINQLPQPNRDTLAFMILHLKCVAESPVCKMPVENLAKVFGPTILGYSEANPSDGDILSETKSQCMVMNLLLKVPSEFWKNIISVDNSVFQPENVPNRNFLMPTPYNTTGQLYKSRGVHLDTAPLTPRHEFGGRRTRQKKPLYFASPLLK